MKERYYRYKIPTSIAVIADLHNKGYKRVLESLTRNCPDIIAIVGDLFYGCIPENGQLMIEAQKNILPFLRGCVEVAPTFMSLGNHEWPISEYDIAVIEANGIRVLDNEWCKCKSIVIGGMTSIAVTEYRETIKNIKIDGNINPIYPPKTILGNTIKKKNINPNEIKWIRQVPSGYKVLLCHHPEYYPLIPKNINLILCGHTHGGQISLLGRGLYAHGQGWFPRYTSGIYHGRMIISSGLSNTLMIPRFFNSKEIVYVIPQ